MTCGYDHEEDVFGIGDYSAFSFSGFVLQVCGIGKIIYSSRILVIINQPELSNRGLDSGDLVGFMPGSCSIFFICVRVPPRRGVERRLYLIGAL